MNTDICKAMVSIAKAIASEGIGKTRKNAQQGYNFRGVDEVMNAFSPILASHGVFVVPSYSDRQYVERVTKSGSALFYVTISGNFTFIHEDGGEVRVGPFFGEAMDSGDKATNKAMAIAYKYAMFQTFCVPLEGMTGGDADLTTHDVVPMLSGKPTDGAWDSMGEEGQSFLQEIAEYCIALIDSGDVSAALDHIESNRLIAEERIALWTRFNSKQRSALKKVAAST
jgi:hypothetical protein